ARAGADPPRRRRDLPRVGALPGGGAGARAAVRGRVGQPQLPGRARGRGDRAPLRRARGRRGGRSRGPRRQARPGHVPRRRRAPRRGAGAGRRVRGRHLRRGGRSGRRLRVGGRGGPGRPRRRPLPPRGRPRGRRPLGAAGAHVSEHPTFTVDPWAITETRLDVDHLARTETIFALSNGHIGLRGNLDEGEPHGVPGSYLNGVFETFPLPYAEDAYAYPREGQSLIDVHNGKHLRLLVDDEPLDVRLGTLEHHERTLDLRAGVLRRELVWTSPSGKTVRVRSTRLVSFSHRSVAAVEYVVESVGAPARVVVQSVLEANEP